MKIFHEIRNYKNNFHVWHSGYRNMSFLAHWHNEVELILVKEGTARITVDGFEYFVKTGDLLVVGSHSLHFNDSYQMPNYLEFILFDPDLIIPNDLAWHKNSYFPAEQLQQLGLKDTVYGLFNSIITELQAENTHYKKIVSSSLLLLWYTLLRHTQELEDKDLKAGIKKLEKSIIYIRMHFREQISLNDVAENVHLSPAYFSGLFHQFVGISFIHYLQIIRIDEAIRLLESSNYKIIDAALDTGFSNIRSFNRVFRKLTEQSPTSFLQAHKGEISHFSLSYNTGEDFQVQNDSFVVIGNRKRLSDR